MSPLRISPNRSAPSVEREPRLRDRHPRLVVQIGTVETRDQHQVGEVELAPDRVDLVGGGVETLLEPLEHRARHRLRDLDPDRLPEPAPAHLELDCLEKVVGLVGDLEVGIPR